MPAYTKRIIREAALKVIKDPRSHPRDIVKALAILERQQDQLRKTKELAREKRKWKERQAERAKKVTVTKSVKVGDILRHVSAA